MKRFHRCWAEIELTALRENLGFLRQWVGPGVRLLTVVKADAYGHGLRQIAALLMQSGTDLFGVANLTEAEAIRSVGKGWPTLMLGACLPAEMESAVDLGVIPTISSVSEARRFSEIAAPRRTTVKVHVKVDTGMGRLGVAWAEARSLVEQVRTLPSLEIEGIYTHYSSAEDDPEYSRIQADRFVKVLDELKAAGICPPIVHASNSAAVLCERDSHFNLVRPGLLVYGVVPPGQRTFPGALVEWLRPALSFYCRVSLVKSVPAGTRLSYGGTFVTTKETRVATLTAGYGDGYMRAGSNRAQVLIGGKRCAVLGRITMDQMLADITDVPHAQPGDAAVLIGRQGAETISVRELADWFGTVPWEVLTGITYRVPRIYRGGHAA